jgi:GWxTD domain-containing protein
MKKSTEKRISVILLFYFFALSSVLGQTEMTQSVESRRPEVHIDANNVAPPSNFEHSRLNLYAEVMYDDLQFVKSDSGFEASYEIAVVIKDKDGEQVDGKIWKEDLLVDNFDETNSRDKFSLTYDSFDLEPGKYKVTVTLQDLESDNITKRDFDTALRDFSKKKLQVSDILIVKNIEYDSLGIKSIWPEVSDRWKGVSNNAFAYFEIYNPNLADEADAEYEIYGQNTKIRFRDKFKVKLAGMRTLSAFHIPTDSLEHDEFKIDLQVKTNKEKDQTEKIFYWRFKGLPATVTDLEAAIQQVQYIATREEWKRLSKASPARKLYEFIQFWKRHDPTPGTEANEAMDAHYARVEYANQNFAVMQREGWRTDMGMVYIVLGVPDDITRNPYPSNSRSYEIWTYYRYNRQFEFYDYTGFGEYRLVYPFSIYDLQRYLTN